MYSRQSAPAASSIGPGEPGVAERAGGTLIWALLEGQPALAGKPGRDRQ
jgi:hypothetical protein